MTTQTKKQLQDKVSKLQNELNQLRESVSTMPEVDHWKPIGGRLIVRSNGLVMECSSYKEYREFGTERATKEQAEKALDAMRVFNRLLAYKDEFAPGFVAGEAGSVVYYTVALEYCCEVEDDLDVEYKQWAAVVCNQAYQLPTDIYFPADIAESLADKLNSGEVTL